MELTQHQKSAIQEAADYLAAEKPDRFVPCDYARRQGVIQGMTEVITNPSKYGLITPVEAFQMARKSNCQNNSMKAELASLRAENQRYKEALEFLLEGVNNLPPLTAIAGTLVEHCKKAQQALKGGDQ